MSVVLLLVSGLAIAAPVAPPDAGAPLSAVECELLLDTMMTLAVTESMANDPEIKKLKPEARAATTRAAKRQSLADPRLSELKRECPKRYTGLQRDCILKAKTMNEVDACTPH